MSEITAFLIWLICIGISAILIGYFLIHLQTPSKKEGFTMHVCPSRSVSYITHDGETRCCNGDVIDGWCNGNDLCTLSPKSKAGLQTCADLVAYNLAVTGAAQCPTKIPNYFASLDGSLRGCSVSQPLPNGIGPSDPNQLQCILYPTPDLDKVRLDSCYNYELQQKQQTTGSQCSSSQGPSNSTEYVLFGGDISGDLPVTKIFDGFTPSDKTPSFKVYCAQGGAFIKFVVVDNAYTKIDNAAYFTGNLSDINDFRSFNTTAGKVGTTQANYNIKKRDGTGILRTFRPGANVGSTTL